MVLRPESLGAGRACHCLGDAPPVQPLQENRGVGQMALDESILDLRQPFLAETHDQPPAGPLGGVGEYGNQCFQKGLQLIGPVRVGAGEDLLGLVQNDHNWLTLSRLTLQPRCTQGRAAVRIESLLQVARQTPRLVTADIAYLMAPFQVR